MKKFNLFLGLLLCSNTLFANNLPELSEVISNLKPESQAIVNSSEHLTKEKLAKLLNIEAGEELIGVKDGVYVVLRQVSKERQREIQQLTTAKISPIIKAKYMEDFSNNSLSYVSYSKAIRDLYDNTPDFKRAAEAAGFK